MIRCVLSLVLSFVFLCQLHATDNLLKLWYKEPAKKWVEALPLGNGRLGAMVFGGIEEELIQLNETSLWSGRPVNLNPNPEAVKYLSLVREALFNGDWGTATDLCHKMQGDYTQSYLPLADLKIRYLFERGSVEEYRRELDISDAINRTCFLKNEVIYEREVFVSEPDQVIVVKLSSSKKGMLNFSTTLASLLNHEIIEKGNTLLLKGAAPVHVDPNYVYSDNPVIYEKDGHQGMRFAVGMDVEIVDGGIEFANEIMTVRGATEAILKIAAATSFNGFDKDPQTEGKNELSLIYEDLNHVKQRNYSEIKRRHIDEYKSWFDRLFLDLADDDSSDASDLDIKERLLAYKEGKSDVQLEELYYHFNRYLMISCSRPNGVPANLQGIWNNILRAPWSSNYTMNINAEMNYWPVEICNLSELHEPFIKQIENLSKNGEYTAKNFFNARGWSLSHNSDIWGQTNPVGNRGAGDPTWANWYMGGPWVCQHLFEHYRFTMDERFLADVAYPIMKKAALFCLDWLVEDSNGWLVTAPSTSPENHYVDENGRAQSVSIATTMDMSLIWDLFTNLIEASKILQQDEEFRILLLEKRGRLYPFHIGKKGNLQEWFKDYEDRDSHHRHVSHLFGLCPGRQITPFKTPELSKACQRTLELRGDNGTGWSLAWKINLWARLLDGDHAYRLFRNLLNIVDAQTENYDGGGSYMNLFCAHPPFQIDGNFGALSGMTEMLIQSHGDLIHLLPALPTAWRNGHIQGVCARNGFELDFKWKDGVLIGGNILSKNGKVCVLRTSCSIEIKGAKFVSKKEVTEWGTYFVTSFETRANKTYQILSL